MHVTDLLWDIILTNMFKLLRIIRLLYLPQPRAEMFALTGIER